MSFAPGVIPLDLLHVSGPLGRGLWSRLKDLYAALKVEEAVPVMEWFLQLSEGRLFTRPWRYLSLGPRTLLDWMGVDRILQSLSTKDDQVALGRLTYFMDGAGKWRYIAIGNWMVQAILKPLHTLIMG